MGPHSPNDTENNLKIITQDIILKVFHEIRT